MDHTETVRAATDQELTYKASAEGAVVSDEESIIVSALTLGEDLEVFDFETPILFQQTEIGRIHLGLTREGLNDVLATTRLLMLTLAFVTIASVVI